MFLFEFLPADLVLNLIRLVTAIVRGTNTVLVSVSINKTMAFHKRLTIVMSRDFSIAGYRFNRKSTVR